MRKFIFLTVLITVTGIIMTSCSSNEKKASESENQKINVMNAKTPYVKKYTNEDYYKDGKLQADVVLKAYEEMLEHYGVELSPFMRENLWITDFELGDFENVGMAGFFWVNDPDNNYFAHEIYLLPGQMITEHKHVATGHSPKMESWVVKNGWVYNYCTGENTPNAPELPKCQEGHITATQFVKQNPGEIIHLNKLEEPHFMMAGPDGAIVFEFASFHDGDGLRFTNPNVVFTDVLSQN